MSLKSALLLRESDTALQTPSGPLKQMASHVFCTYITRVLAIEFISFRLC